MSDLHYFHKDWIKPSDAAMEADICVYGGTAAGVVAAVIAAERGKRVVLLNPARHLGGMSSGGLGWTDFGNKHVIGGRSRRFYEAVGEHYGKEAEWQFEPKVAEAVFERWVKAADVPVHHAAFLERAEMDGGRVAAVTMLGGLTVKAKRFIDATYEGDLMAAAGVKYTVGREANSVYGELLNGIQVRDKHQFSHPVDPFVKEGDPSSGLLPHVEAVDQTEHQGEGDHRVQAYCFRVCMTDDPALKVDWARPAGFDPAEYVLATRWFNSDKDRYNDQLPHNADPQQHLRDAVPVKFDRFPNKTPGGHYKTDTNNHGPISSDYIGMSWEWPEGCYEKREQVFQAHATYQQGFYWFMANDPSIPLRYREAYQRWGLPNDEFTDTGHWPHQLYIREARRMVGKWVITEADCKHEREAEDSVGMGSYTMDSHNCTRFVRVDDAAREAGLRGRVMNDGDVQVKPTDPYPVSYRAIVPDDGQCPNLLVPVCFSASHIAYGSARMEPVFMVLGESAAIAACLSLEADADVQALPYDELKGELVKAEQVLSL